MASIRKRFGKWQVQIRRNNYPQIIKSFLKKSTATKYAREIELKIDKQQFEDYSVAANTTLKEALIRYRDEITPKKKGAIWETYKLNLLIRNKISLLSLLKLNSTDLYSLKNELSKKRKPSTVKHYFNLINNTWNTAQYVWGIVLPPKNPVKFVTLDKVYDRRERILNKDEYRKLLETSSNSNLKILKDMIVFAYNTAMRFGEIIKLSRKDVNINNKLITLRDTKNGEDRTIPISDIAIEILKKYPFGDKYFLIKRDKFRHYFEQACKRAEINNFRFHDLRACAITNMFLSGMSLPEVALISGHKTWSQLGRYTRIKAEHLVDKINLNKLIQ